MKYSQETYDNAKRLNFRFTLLKLIDFCKSTKNQYVMLLEFNEASEWRLLEKEFLNILELYDNGAQFNDNIKIDNTSKLETLANKKLAIERIIKLIKIKTLN